MQAKPYITGIVTNDGTAVSNATVIINHQTALTNESGIYNIEKVPIGTNTITSFAQGYANSWHQSV